MTDVKTHMPETIWTDTCRKIGRDIFFSGADTPHADGDSTEYLRKDVHDAAVSELTEGLREIIVLGLSPMTEPETVTATKMYGIARELFQKYAVKDKP